MSSVVRGKTNHIAPPNLATNGGFRFNQRGTFSTLTPAKGGDYISDCWYLHGNTNVDYVEIANNTTNGFLDFAGYGKKGQTILVYGRDKQPYGFTFAQSNVSSPIYDNAQIPSTACISVINYKVPVTVVAAPRYNADGDTWLINKSDAATYFGTGKVGDTKPMITKHKGASITGGGFIEITLQEDGEYAITLACYRDLAGAFKNPPKYAPVPYADDLARCQRYYYRSSAVRPLGRAIKVDTNVVRYSEIHQFPTTMAAIPSVTAESEGSTGDHIAYTGSGGGSSLVVLPNGSGASGNTTTSQTRIWVEYSGLTSTQTNYALDNGIASYYSITAEVV